MQSSCNCDHSLSGFFALGLLLFFAFLFIRGYIRSRRVFCTTSDKAMRRLFRRFDHRNELNIETSKHGCWIADGHRGIGGRTFYVERPRELGVKVVEFLRSKGFNPTEPDWGNSGDHMTIRVKGLCFMDDNLAFSPKR